MKAVILAGGYGTRLAEETNLLPKPMVEIGGKPILWHIMKIFASHGVDDFIICCGYKGYKIKEYFTNYYLHQSDIKISLDTNKIDFFNNKAEAWKITLVDTGQDTLTGGRLKRIKKYIANEKNFCLTYGDGLTNVNISELIKFHQKQNAIVSLTAAKPPGRYGVLNISENNFVTNFREKPEGENSWINAGFFVINPEALNFINGDETSWETDVLHKFAKDLRLSAFRHDGFFQPMDTIREKNYLNKLWNSGNAPWKIWD